MLSEGHDIPSYLRKAYPNGSTGLLHEPHRFPIMHRPLPMCIRLCDSRLISRVQMFCRISVLGLTSEAHKWLLFDPVNRLLCISHAGVLLSALCWCSSLITAVNGFVLFSSLTVHAVSQAMLWATLTALDGCRNCSNRI
jgi:hypothetical protein